jgi:hypothetical protein
MPLDVYVTDYEEVLKPLTTAQVDNVTETLNDVPTMNFSISQDEPNASYIGGMKREIRVVESLGNGIAPEIVFQGPVVSESGDSNIANFQCEGVATHLNDRRIDDASLYITSIEQRTIGYMLIAYAQSEATQANRDFNISYASFTGTTHIRSRDYNREEHPVILDLLKEFPTLQDGFDWDIVIAPDGARVWTPYYPKKGSYKPELAVQYELGGQRGLTDFTYKRDWKRITTEAYGVGGVSDGMTREEQRYEDVAASAEHGVRQRVVSDSSTDRPWLLDKATKEVNTFKNAVFLPQVKTVRVPLDYRRLITTGDTIPVSISRGRVQEVGVRRILQKSWSPKEDAVDLTFVDVAAA